MKRITLKELEDDLKECREEGASDNTLVKFFFFDAPKSELQILSIYRSKDYFPNNDVVYFDVEWKERE